MDLEKADVVFYIKYNFHHSILDEINDHLLKKKINSVIVDHRHEIYDTFDRTNRKFPVFVIADEWFSLFRKCSDNIITTGHSLVSKNVTFNKMNCEGDYICVSSQWQKNEFISRGVMPRKKFLMTGYPAADRIFRNELRLSSEFSKLLSPESSMNRTSKIRILFAPTYNRDLSMMDNLIKHKSIFEFLGRKYDLAFKLHPVLPKKYPEHAEFVDHLVSEKLALCPSDSHADISDAIVWSDIVVGDCSGAMMLSMIKKPIIAYDNPRRFSSPYFDEKGPEWTLRNRFAYRMTEFEELPDVLDKILDYDEKKKTRKEVVDLIYGDFKDGNSAFRIAESILEILAAEKII